MLLEGRTYGRRHCVERRRLQQEIFIYPRMIARGFLEIQTDSPAAVLTKFNTMRQLAVKIITIAARIKTCGDTVSAVGSRDSIEYHLVILKGTIGIAEEFQNLKPDTETGATHVELRPSVFVAVHKASLRETVKHEHYTSTCIHLFNIYANINVYCSLFRILRKLLPLK